MVEPLGSSAIGLLNSGDRLDDDVWLRGALRRWGIPARRLDHGDREALRSLRSTLLRLTRSLDARGGLTPRELAELNRLIGATPVRAQLREQPGGGYLVEMAPVAAEWRELAVRELAGAFASLLRQAHPQRLKLCESCGTVFWDGTRSRTRRWCDSRTCGNRERVRRFRASRAS